MSLLRFVARSMFASYFILDGLKAASKPAERASMAEPFTEKAVPVIQRLVPASYSSAVPEQAETWVRLSGFAKVAGGAMFALGLGRRLGACLLATGSVLDVASTMPGKDASAEEKAAGKHEALAHVALLGGALLASRDLQGKPSLGWRAEQKQKLAMKQAAALGGKAGKATKRAQKRARKLAKDIKH